MPNNRTKTVAETPVEVGQVYDELRDTYVYIKYHRKDRYFYARVDNILFKRDNQATVEALVQDHLGQNKAQVVWFPVLVWVDEQRAGYRTEHTINRYELSFDGVVWRRRKFGSDEAGEVILNGAYGKDKAPLQMEFPACVQRDKGYGGGGVWTHYLPYDEDLWLLVRFVRDLVAGLEGEIGEAMRQACDFRLGDARSPERLARLVTRGSWFIEERRKSKEADAAG